jgi:mannosyl-oligosaccharide alpha-1,2-mannosidase
VHGSRRGIRWRGKRGVGMLALVVIGVLYWLGWFGSSGGETADGEGKSGVWSGLRGAGKAKGKVDWAKRRDDVKGAFLLSWGAYQEHGWGEFWHIGGCGWKGS